MMLFRDGSRGDSSAGRCRRGRGCLNARNDMLAQRFSRSFLMNIVMLGFLGSNGHYSRLAGLVVVMLTLRANLG